MVGLMFIKFHDKQKCLGASPDISRVTLQLLKRSTHHSPSLANPNGGEPDILSDWADMLSKQKIFVKFIKEIFFQEKQEISLGRSCSTHSDPHPCQSNLLQAKSLVNNLPMPINHLLHLLLFLQSANQTLGVSIISVRKQTQANSVHRWEVGQLWVIL